MKSVIISTHFYILLCWCFDFVNQVIILWVDFVEIGGIFDKFSKIDKIV